ncbi:tRNA nucleotidyltransferase [Mycobacterium phage Phabba]|uniref:tRNA nucleotidyltransferase n=1 Tax=Mycobacterium phage Phabba TaxID=2027899 RepID=A0A249XS88_9CAUD|nr:tRNA nucleotidyltransferase [Mycobacterium phage Phabba]ASZ74607.1 tRNA nucleotidyltransferase [Mycobacterium phage Phabba]
MNDQLMRELGARFERADRVLFLVGGSVRDMALGKPPKDFDFTTDALPNEILGILRGWADATWDVGARFGTIAAQKDGFDVEITTMRHDGPGRKPEVTFTDSLEEDLIRRDFSINAMAMQVDSAGLHGEIADIIDPFNGRTDLFLELLKTPAEPWKTFTEDPLRMLRAARFAGQLGFKVGNTEELSIHSNRALIQSVSAERIAAELDKLLMGEFASKGIAVLAQTGLLTEIFGDLVLSADVRNLASIEARWADLLHAVDPQAVIALLKRLKMSTARIQAVSELVAWNGRWGKVDWKSAPLSEVRRLVAAAGPQLARLEGLIDSDVLSRRVESLLDTEGHPKPLLTGKEILMALGVQPGPIVGKAQQFLWELRLTEGALCKHHAAMLLKDWADIS